MPNVKVVNMAGKEVGEITLSDAVFGVEVNATVLHSAVRAYLMNQRQGTQSTLTRTEVSGGGRKPWRQKGTGRARQGSTRSPQWTHGGVALGPKPREYRVTLNKKTKRLALKSALSDKVANGNMIVVDSIIAEEYKEDSLYKELRDYKLFVFNGKVKLLKIDFDRFSNHGANYFDVNGNLLDIGEEYCPPNKNKDLNMPYNLPKMIEFAEKLANEIDFLRVDFYEVDNKIYFGELTFYPMSGFGKFLNDKDDLFLGGLLNINKS